MLIVQFIHRITLIGFTAALVAWPSIIASEQVSAELFKLLPPTKNQWPDEKVYEYEVPAFAFPRIPLAYDQNGIRDEWPNPLLIKATGQINFPSGDHRFLLRSRRAARFFIDGQLVISNPFPDKIQDGQEPVERPFIPLGPNIRFPAPGDQEALVSYKLDAGFHNFQLEFYVGGFAGKQALRPETGETLVAVALEGESNFHILSSDLSIPLTDQAWHQFRLETDTALDQIDDDRRRNFKVIKRNTGTVATALQKKY